MIVRLSSTVVRVPELNVYTEYVQSAEIARYESTPGLVSVSVLQRPFVGYVELLTVSLWESAQALALFAEEPPRDEVKSPSSVVRLQAHTYELVLFRKGKVRGGEVQACKPQEEESPPG
jgi:hypothetical protein